MMADKQVIVWDEADPIPKSERFMRNAEKELRRMLLNNRKRNILSRRILFNKTAKANEIQDFGESEIEWYQERAIHCPDSKCKGMLLTSPFVHEKKCSDCNKRFIDIIEWKEVPSQSTNKINP